MPPAVPGQPIWTSDPQKQVIRWGSDYHGSRWRLAAQWTRLNQTAVTLTVSGTAADLSNPRNGLTVQFGQTSPKNCSFSISANSTWAHRMIREVITKGVGSQWASTENTGLQISGSAEMGSITFLVATAHSVNPDLLSADTGLNATFVCFPPLQAEITNCIVPQLVLPQLARCGATSTDDTPAAVCANADKGTCLDFPATLSGIIAKILCCAVSRGAWECPDALQEKIATSRAGFQRRNYSSD
jgi:hypothetical protein